MPSGFDDLAVQARRDDAQANGRGRGTLVTDRRQQATDELFDEALTRARARDAQEAQP